MQVTAKNRISKHQLIECFKAALPDFLKEAHDYEAKKSFPNGFKIPAKRNTY